MSEKLTEEIEDLKVFADPFEVFTPMVAADGWTAQFVRKGHNIVLRREPNEIVRTLRGPRQLQLQHLSFKGLLVSETFADLGRLATAQKHRTSSLVDQETKKLKDFLPIAGKIRRSDGQDEDLTFERVCEILDRTDDRLRIVIIDGNAGVGKSHLIERLVRGRAEPSSYTSGSPLLLHVESRGKVLTSLNDRIAGTLSSLRASFVEEELKPLIRRGAVQLAIDGFDELSDSRGYDRAWGALRDFIRELGGKGTCILAGRNTMLDRQTVLDGLGSSVSDDSIVFFRLLDPAITDIAAWLSKRENWKSHDLRPWLHQIESSEYIRRPFFVSRIADLGPESLEDTQGEPVAELVESIVRREGPKLPGAASDVISERLSELYGEALAQVASMMMDDETDEIEIGYVEMLIEEAFADEVNPETVRALFPRAKALALLEEVPGDHNKRKFPHETIRSYFFGQSVFGNFSEHGPTTGLYRVPLSAEDFRIFNRVARRRGLDEQRRLREALLSELAGSSRYDYLRSNIGGFLLAFAPLLDDGDNELELSRLDLLDVWMGNLIGMQKIHLKGCVINRLDVRGADLRDVRFSNTEVHELVADPFVKFGSSVPEVQCLIRYEDFSKVTRMYDGISEWLANKQAGPAPLTDTAPDARWDLLEKFARISMSQYAIRENPDPADVASTKILRSPHWESLRELLERHERLTRPNMVAGNGRANWFHLVAGKDFLDQDGPVKESTTEILKELNAPRR